MQGVIVETLEHRSGGFRFTTGPFAGSSFVLPPHIEGCVSRKLLDTGFHPRLSTNVQISPRDLPLFEGNCTVVLQETVFEHFFVDIYQLADGVQFGGPKVRARTSLDLEKPSSSATQHLISLEAPLTLVRHSEESSTFEPIVYPIHLRYQDPSVGDSALSASALVRHSVIPTPSVFVNCGNWPEAARVPEDLLSALMPSRGLHFEPRAGWRRLVPAPSCPVTDPVSFEVPVGNRAALGLVTWGTLLATLLGAVSVIFSAQRSTRDHKKVK